MTLVAPSASAAPPQGTSLRTHYRGYKEKKAQHPVGIEPKALLLRGALYHCATTVDEVVY